MSGRIFRFVFIFFPLYLSLGAQGICRGPIFSASNLPGGDLLGTQVVNRAFYLDIKAKCPNTGERPADMSVTVDLLDDACGSRLQTLGTGIVLNAANGYRATLENLTIASVNRDLWVRITDEGDGSVSNCSADAFAARPEKLTVLITKKDGTPLNNTMETGTPTQKAGDDFKITVKALDAYGAVVPGFNESFALSRQNHDSGGVTGDLNLDPADLQFSDGIKVLDANYSEAGSVDINISANPAYAAVDTTDGSDYVIPGSGQRAGRFIPDHFMLGNIDLSDLNVTNRELNGSCSYTYLSILGKHDMIARVGMDVYAKNRMGTVTKNYDGPSVGSAMLSLVLDWNISSENYAYGGSETMHSDISERFVSGEAAVTQDLTARWSINPVALVDRKKPFEPFDLNISDPERINLRDFFLSDGDGVRNDPVDTFTRSAASKTGDMLYFVYGRINPIDAKADSGSVLLNANIYYETYAATPAGKSVLSRAMGVNESALQESVNDVFWWRNVKHEACDRVPLDYSLSPAAAPVADRDHDRVSFSGAPGRVRVEIDLQSQDFLYHHPYSEENISSFYLEFVGTDDTATVGNDVVTNEGKAVKNSNRIGE